MMRTCVFFLLALGLAQATKSEVPTKSEECIPKRTDPMMKFIQANKKCNQGEGLYATRYLASCGKTSEELEKICGKTYDLKLMQQFWKLKTERSGCFQLYVIALVVYITAAGHCNQGLGLFAATQLAGCGMAPIALKLLCTKTYDERLLIQHFKLEVPVAAPDSKPKPKAQVVHIPSKKECLDEFLVHLVAFVVADGNCKHGHGLHSAGYLIYCGRTEAQMKAICGKTYDEKLLKKYWDLKKKGPSPLGTVLKHTRSLKKRAEKSV